MRIEVKDGEKDKDVSVKVFLKQSGDDVHICLEREGGEVDIAYLTECSKTNKMKLELFYISGFSRGFYNIKVNDNGYIESNE